MNRGQAMDAILRSKVTGPQKLILLSYLSHQPYGGDPATAISWPGAKVLSKACSAQRSTAVRHRTALVQMGALVLMSAPVGESPRYRIDLDVVASVESTRTKRKTPTRDQRWGVSHESTPSDSRTGVVPQSDGGASDVRTGGVPLSDTNTLQEHPQPNTLQERRQGEPVKPAALPPVPAWATKAKPRGCTPRELATAVLLIASKVTRRKLEPVWAEACNWPHGEQGKPIKGSASKTLVAGTVSLLRTNGWPDLDEWVEDATAVAWAFHKSPHPLFAGDVRAEGWDRGTDRSRSMSTFACQKSWDERVRVATESRAAGKGGHSPSGTAGNDSGGRSASASDIALALWREYKTADFGNMGGRLAKHGVTPELFQSWIDMTRATVDMTVVQHMTVNDEPFRRREYLPVCTQWVAENMMGAT